ncbi:MAG: response regulator [Patescibacteria group bacterium]
MPENKKTVFLVEDDSAIIDIYQTAMKKADFDVEVISLGQDVISKIKSIQAEESKKPDIILLDLILPDMNGAEILEELKKNSQTKNIPVFVISNQQEEESMQALKSKPDKFIMKANITPTQLVELIKERLS